VKRLLISVILSLGIHALLLGLDAEWFRILQTPRPHPNLTTISLIALSPQGVKEANTSEKPSTSIPKKARDLPPKKPLVPKPVVRQKTRQPENPAISTLEPSPLKKAPKAPPTVKKDVSKNPIKPKKSLKKITRKQPTANPTITAEKTVPPEPQSEVKRPDESLDKLEPEESRSETFDTATPVPPQNNSDNGTITKTAPENEAAMLTTKGGPPAARGLIMARPLYRKNPSPRYPRQARRKGYEGTVILEVLVNQKGTVNDLRVFQSSGYEILDQSAVEAVHKWVFEPGTRNGQATKTWVRVPIRFKLN
jgi:protein TonB